MSELIIRKAEEKDIPSVAAVEKQCFTVPWSFESLHHDILENRLSFYIVAEVGGTVCGYVGIWKIVDEGHITNVAVSPQYRRKHIASAMLDVLLAACEESGIRRFTLEVRKGNEAARRLYEKKGFRDAGVREGYYDDNGEDAVIMWRE
ncbi:MAG: ribosomal protein S18-alanine N-acetyltransferase [Firmicutes bacterium]|nr:ribosomal protein S18-alanine N-acetyltransferase [Bacillota bacterium]MDD7602987.1 ribosomal protein S18-alanine N-acetyltransferase [Bacillota bacterium]MDY5857325.1 ribosomal protein S18-alanine N-acetyltransferase [Anaerovoracaceae bacterium]